MDIGHRPMLSRDVGECAAIIAGHPVNGLRYADGASELELAWGSLLGCEAFRAVVFEDRDGPGTRLAGAGVSVFVRDEFLVEMKSPPLRWVGPELARRVTRGQSPLLSDREVRAANADAGLNLLVWDAALRDEYRNLEAPHKAVFTAFAEEHRGFRLKELLAQAAELEQLEGMIRSGGALLAPDGSYCDRTDVSLREVLGGPHFLGMTRDLALQRFGTWIGMLFHHQVPQFGFRPSEQRLLLAALRGGTDEELSAELGVSLSGVKKTWLAVYERAAARLPRVLGADSRGREATERGKEKKARLLTYLREHPEELRPASPQALPRNAGSRARSPSRAPRTGRRA